MHPKDCPFCNLAPDRILLESAATLAFLDGYPTAVLPRRLRRPRTALKERFNFSDTSRSINLPSKASSSFVQGNWRAERNPAALFGFRCGWDEDGTFIASTTDYWSCRFHGKHNWRKQKQVQSESLPLEFIALSSKSTCSNWHPTNKK